LYRWFVGAEVNSCYNALDIHVENGRSEQLALIYDSHVTNTVKKSTYRELQDQVAKLAGALVNMGVGKGDRVIIYKKIARLGVETAVSHPPNFTL